AMPGAVCPVTSTLGNGAAVTLLMPADATSRYVRIQGLSGGLTTIPTMPTLSAAAVAFSVDLYDASSGTVITEFPQPITAGVRVPADVDPAALVGFRFDPVSANVEQLGVVPDPVNHIVQFMVTGPGYFVLGAAAQ